MSIQLNYPPSTQNQVNYADYEYPIIDDNYQWPWPDNFKCIVPTGVDVNGSKKFKLIDIGNYSFADLTLDKFVVLNIDSNMLEHYTAQELNSFYNSNSNKFNRPITCPVGYHKADGFFNVMTNVSYFYNHMFMKPLKGVIMTGWNKNAPSVFRCGQRININIPCAYLRSFAPLVNNKTSIIWSIKDNIIGDSSAMGNITSTKPTVSGNTWYDETRQCWYADFGGDGTGFAYTEFVPLYNITKTSATNITSISPVLNYQYING